MSATPPAFEEVRLPGGRVALKEPARDGHRWFWRRRFRAEAEGSCLWCPCPWHPTLRIRSARSARRRSSGHPRTCNKMASALPMSVACRAQVWRPSSMRLQTCVMKTRRTSHSIADLPNTALTHNLQPCHDTGCRKITKFDRHAEQLDAGQRCHGVCLPRYASDQLCCPEVCSQRGRDVQKMSLVLQQAREEEVECKRPRRLGLKENSSANTMTFKTISYYCAEAAPNMGHLPRSACRECVMVHMLMIAGGLSRQRWKCLGRVGENRAARSRTSAIPRDPLEFEDFARELPPGADARPLQTARRLRMPHELDGPQIAICERRAQCRSRIRLKE